MNHLTTFIVSLAFVAAAPSAQAVTIQVQAAVQGSDLTREAIFPTGNFAGRRAVNESSDARAFGSLENVTIEGVAVDAGTLAVSVLSGPAFNRAEARASIFSEPINEGPQIPPLLTNISDSPQLMSVRLNYDGIYFVPDIQDAIGTSVAAVSLRTSEGSSSVFVQHDYWYSDGVYRSFEDIRKPGNEIASTLERPRDTEGLLGFEATIETIALSVMPNENPAFAFASLEVNAAGGGSARFGNTGYLSIFVEDKSAFSYDPRFVWICEFGEECNGPDADLGGGSGGEPDINPVPLPASFSFLGFGLASLLIARRRRARST